MSPRVVPANPTAARDAMRVVDCSFCGARAGDRCVGLRITRNQVHEERLVALEALMGTKGDQ